MLYSNSTSVSKWNMENYISFGTDLALYYVIYLWKCFVIHIAINVVSEVLVIYIIYFVKYMHTVFRCLLYLYSTLYNMCCCHNFYCRGTLYIR